MTNFLEEAARGLRAVHAAGERSGAHPPVPSADLSGSVQPARRAEAGAASGRLCPLVARGHLSTAARGSTRGWSSSRACGSGQTGRGSPGLWADSPLQMALRRGPWAPWGVQIPGPPPLVGLGSQDVKTQAGSAEPRGHCLLPQITDGDTEALRGARLTPAAVDRRAG